MRRESKPYETEKDFWESIVNEKEEYDYIVDLTEENRAIRFLVLDEKQYDENTFITSTALLALSTELAEYYIERKRFPNILLCVTYISMDDWIVKAFLDRLENQIINHVKEKDKKADIAADVYKRLSFSIFIKIYAKRYDTSTLPIGYIHKQYNVSKHEIIPNATDYGDINLSRDLMKYADLERRHGFSYNNFILRALVDEKKFENIKSDYERYETAYRGNIQTVYTKTLDFGAGPKAILTIRKNGEERKEGKCYIIPNVFITEFEKPQKEKFINIVFNSIRDKNIQEKFSNQLSNLKNVENEFVSVLLNQILLSAFMEKGGLVQEDTDLEKEIHKVAHNFGNSLEIYEVISYIKRNKLFTEEEFINIINELTKNSNSICMLDGSKEKSKIKTDNLMDYIENYFYEMSLEQQKIYEGIRKAEMCQRFKPIEWQIKCIKVNEFLRQAYPNNQNSLGTIIAYLLQMIDSGIIKLPEFSYYECIETNYVQYFSFGNIARYIAVMNICKYIDILKHIELVVWHKYGGMYKLNELVEILIKENKFNYPKEDIEKIRIYLREYDIIPSQRIHEANKDFEFCKRDYKTPTDYKPMQMFLEAKKIREEVDEIRRLFETWNKD